MESVYNLPELSAFVFVTIFLFNCTLLKLCDVLELNTIVCY